MSVEKGTFAGDLTLPLFAVRNAFGDATYSAPSGIAVAARSPQTASAWQSEGYDEIEAIESARIDYIGAYIRTDSPCIVQPQYLDGSVWLDWDVAVEAPHDMPMLWLNAATDVLGIRLLVISGSPKIANFKAGRVDVIPVGLPIGYQPGYLNPQDVLTNIVSRKGQILGSNIERSGVVESLEFQQIEQAWVRSDWLAIRDAIRTEAVYFAWCAEDFPDELVYAMAQENPSASYSAGEYMDISIQLEGPSSGA